MYPRRTVEFDEREYVGSSAGRPRSQVEEREIVRTRTRSPGPAMRGARGSQTTHSTQVDVVEERDMRRSPSRSRVRVLDRDDVDVRVRERSESRLPAFMRSDARPHEPAGQLVLRQRDVETYDVRRDPSPVRERTRVVSTERVREPSRAPSDRFSTTRVETKTRRDPDPERFDYIRTTRFEDDEEDDASSRPVERERIRIVEEERERTITPAPAPAPPPPQPVKLPPIERDVITHYRSIDHGVVEAPRPRREKPEKKHTDTEIDVYTSRRGTEVDVHRSSSRTRNPSRDRRSRSRERHPHRYEEDEDDEVIVQADHGRLRVEIDRERRASSEAPVGILKRGRDASPSFDDEADAITRRIDSRGRMGEARDGITKDWTIVDVPPGTERVRMDGVGGASAEVTWQRYAGVRRARFIPDRDATSSVVSRTTVSSSDMPLPAAPQPPERETSRVSVQIVDKDREVDVERVTERRPRPAPHAPHRRRDDMWTEITKDLVVKEAVERLGYDYEETDYFFYVMQYLRYDDVLQLVQLSDHIRKRRHERARQLEYERRRQADLDWAMQRRAQMQEAQYQQAQQRQMNMIEHQQQKMLPAPYYEDDVRIEHIHRARPRSQSRGRSRSRSRPRRHDEYDEERFYERETVYR